MPRWGGLPLLPKCERLEEGLTYLHERRITHGVRFDIKNLTIPGSLVFRISKRTIYSSVTSISIVSISTTTIVGLYALKVN
ncbi:hypothetical protein C0989_010241 [Termitomyces sp. Mn162]|nr:hypothetical protein C0989_010241 [Termitomyces sp. Mn162]